MATKEEQRQYDEQHPLLRELDKKLGGTFTGVKDGFICIQLPDMVMKEES